MNKMRNAKKGLIVATIALVFTMGIFALKNYILAGPEGLRLVSPIDLLFGLPALPFIWLYLIFPETNTSTITATILLVSIIFWLLVGYGIGTWMDKKQNKK